VTLRGRLTLLCALLLAVSLGLAEIALYETERHDLAGQIDGLLRARATQVTPDVVQELLAEHALLPKQRANHGLSARQPSSHHASLITGWADLALITVNGAVAGHSLVDPAGNRPRAVASGRRASYLQALRTAHGRVRVLVFHAGPATAGVITVSLATMDHRLARLRTVLLIIDLAMLVLVPLLSGLVARRALRPISLLSDAAEGVSEPGDFTRRIEVAGHDEVGRLGSAINAMLARLQRSVEAQRQLVADASHEFRTPLTSVSANLQLLDEPGGLSAPDARQLVAEARVQARVLTQLVDDVVQLARHGEPELHLEAVRLDLVARDATHRIDRGAPDVEFILDLDECWVTGDRDLLFRAVNNLLENAAKWSPPGGTVSVTVTKGAVAIHDQGPGIAEHDLPFVFDRFYRSKDALGVPGSGLGLAIVRRVSEAHGGTVSASSDATGTTMHLVLPVADAPSLAVAGERGRGDS
jgi:two-component system, OmpR family, sensor histidine kinase MprB